MDENNLKLSNKYSTNNRNNNYFFSLAIAAIVVVFWVFTQNIVVLILVGSAGMAIIYSLFYDEKKWTPQEIIIEKDGIHLYFPKGRSVFLQWNDIKAWSQYKTRGQDIYVGIWLPDMKNIYRVEKEVAKKILDAYQLNSGKPLPERP
jgi:hypothetical protein